MNHSLTLRRKRLHPILRDALREIRLHPSQLIAPVFVAEGATRATPLKGLVDHEVHTVDSSLKYVERLVEQRVKNILLFGVPKEKRADAEQTCDPKGVVPQTVQALRRAFGENVFTWVDVCLCSATDTGQCGFLDERGTVDNSATVEHLARTALTYAQAGADGVAPSDMMDGRVAAIRQALDENGQGHVPIMSYASKFASAFYGPFREAAQSSPKQAREPEAPRANYQIDPAHWTDAIQSAERDVREGADILMVKPAMPYLDILHELNLRGIGPLAAYQVSGEYASLMMLAKEGYADASKIFHESVTSILRAGAQLVITYAAELLLKGGSR